jgi:hypothetical protein
MAASLTLYCLEKLTDYLEFECLCHDLMILEGYNALEPLGSFKDKGRDAIHINQAGEITIFAYSVRDDWKKKLLADAANIAHHGHACHKLVFTTTSQPTSSERDKVITAIQEQYGWKLEIYGLKRLRLLLDVEHPEVKLRYPHIFPPAFFSNSNEVRSESNDLVKKRLEAYETLFYKIKKAAGIIQNLFESKDLSIEEKQGITYSVGLNVAELTEQYSFYLNDEVTIHVVGTFVGLPDIFGMDEPKLRQNEINVFLKNIRNAYRMIASLRDTGKLDQSITSPLVDYFRFLRKEQDEQDRIY